LQLEESEHLQQDIRHCHRQHDEELIDILCQAVVDYHRAKEGVYTRNEAFDFIYSGNNVSDAELIRRTGISRQMIYKWRKGTAKIRPYHLMSLANAVGKLVVWKDRYHERCSFVDIKQQRRLYETSSEEDQRVQTL